MLAQDAGTKLSSCDGGVGQVEVAWRELQLECGLELTSNMKQCLKIAISRFFTHPDNYSLSIESHDGVSNSNVKPHDGVSNSNVESHDGVSNSNVEPTMA